MADSARRLWLDDVQVGDTFRSETYEITAESIIGFAAEWDPQPFHLDPDAAGASFFQGLAASGWQTAAVTMRLIVSCLPLATGIIGMGIDLSWPSPVRPGDQLHVVVEVTDVRRSGTDPQRGYLTTTTRTVNQHGDIRQLTTGRLLAFSRPAN